MIYIPKRLEDEVKVSTERFFKIKEMLEEVAAINFERLLDKMKKMFRRIIRYFNKHFSLFKNLSSITDKRLSPRIDTIKIVTAVINM